ncbi:MAG: hypothetical protein HOE90_06525 [Bacteriovoracaceae bacterium]|jgi:hypothetical protein|nr:hypothetical protein [Bacteriovoracaceae bacterium]
MIGPAGVLNLSLPRYKLGGADHLTFITMLATTNDAIALVEAVKLPTPAKRKHDYVSVEYDAGSEVNSEACEYIPGPPCGNMFKRDPENSVVSLFGGIKGVGDLQADEFGLSGAAAKVVIELK